MSNEPKPDFRTVELDAGLSSTPFGVDTDWHVITGTVCSGKTTMIDQLAKQGFQTVPEAGRQYFESEMAKGRTIDEIRQDMTAVVRGLVDVQLATEHRLRPGDVLFLDRAIPDAPAFSRCYGLDPNEFLAECFHHRYASVFLLDRLPVEQDGVRAEDDETACFLDDWLASDYAALGYDVVRVPVLPRKERLAFVLERLGGE